MNLIAISVFLCLFIIVESQKPNNRLLGGFPIKKDNFPFLVAIYKNEFKFMCAGTIVHPQFILTAGQCIFNVYASDISIRVGSKLLNEGGKVIQVHSRMQGSTDFETFQHDIALLKIENRLVFNQTFHGMRLPPRNMPLPPLDTFIPVFGWGIRRKKGTLNSARVKRANLNVMDIEECRKMYKPTGLKVTDNMFCVGSPKFYRNACYGDLGGPALYGFNIIGIISWTHLCRYQLYPVVLAKVTSVLPWINDTITSFAD